MPVPAQGDRELIAVLRETYDFLITDYGYSPPFRIAARIDDCVILAYRNASAGRQVEVSGDPGGYRTHCEILRLVNGEPGGYGADSIAIWELRMVREPQDGAQEPLERDAALRRNAGLLKRQSAIVTGKDWIDRDEIRRVVQREWFGKLGIAAPEKDAPSLLDRARHIAAFLVNERGFTLEFDSSTLSPHEHQMWRELRYRRGTTSIAIVNGDVRVQSEWYVQLNGKTVSELSGEFESWLARTLEDLAPRQDRP